jgi:cytochrome P450
MKWDGEVLVDTSADVTDLGALFSAAEPWSDMDAWHEKVAALRCSDPILHIDSERFAPFWVLLRHPDVLDVSRDSDTWLNTPFSVLNPDSFREGLEASGNPPPASLVHLDGDKHNAYRRVANDWFKPAAVGKRQARIDELADRYIDRMRMLDGACDFARDVAQPYTLSVIMDIYGVPAQDEQLMLELTQGVFGNRNPEFMGDAHPGEKVVESVARFSEYFDGITADRRVHPREDLATVIANGEINGCPLGESERLWYYIIVATAGHDTTSYALSGGLEALLRDPSQFAALREDPELVTTAADEVIRWTTPVRHFLRYASRETKIRGITVPEGGRVLLSYPSANRDEQVFEDSMRFNVRRTDADRLLSFGLGVHFCLGAQFARREIRTMLNKLSQQLASIELADEVEWSEGFFVSGVNHLPIRYSFR